MERPGNRRWLATLVVLIVLSSWILSLDTSVARQALQSPDASLIAGNGSYESDDPCLLYQGSWSPDPAAAGASGGEARVSSSPGSEVSMDFVGSAVTWWTATGPAEGAAFVWIDDHAAPMQDLYSLGEKQWRVARRFTVPQGQHHIRIVVSDSRNVGSTGYNVTLDALSVEGSPFEGAATPTPAPPPTATPAVWLDAQVGLQRPAEGPPESREASVTLWVHSGGTANSTHQGFLFTAHGTTDETGRVLFGLDGAPPAEYDLYLKGAHSLGSLARNRSLVSGVNQVEMGTLREGDTDGS
ncbi:MAG TPA: hypothetical protein VFD42_08820, partial [Chloroflexota bacterium]|nr:hypothetical protein [Chloroflexota bacterium]